MSKPEVGWSPHPGPQTKFLASQVREGLYGGAAGGGKTDALIYGGVRQVHIPGFRALFLRRTFPELREVMDRTHALFQRLGGKWRETEKRWEFPSGATYEFGYAESYRDVLQYQGQEFQYIAVDEIGLWPEERMWTFLGTRCRSKDRNIVRMMRASANPGGAGHGWLRKRFISVCRPDGTPYEDPVTGLTRAYVQAKVWDNPSIVENDPEYIAYLRGLPTTMRRQLLDGDWDAGTGLAFERLSESEHLVPYRRPEKWETVFAALDWGYSHNFSAGLYVVGRDGRVTKVDTVMGRRLSPEQIVERCRECFMGHGVPFSRLSYTVAGSDVKMVEKARGTWGPSILEQFMMAGWMLIGADQSRISGYQNMLRYVDWERTKEKHRKPLFQLMDTPGNRRALDCLRTLTVDPDSPNDVLKVDADADSGEGGDDAYDETRYALMSRPLGVQAPQKPEDRVNRALPEPQRPLKSATKPGWAYQLPSRTGTTGKGEVIQ